jgi:hypothetical protein
VRSVVVVGDRLHDERGRVVGTQGFYIDTTPDEREQQDLMTAQLAAIAESRAVVEQAKGVLMAVYGITGDRAFEILVWRSQETNLKLREVASRFVDAISASHLSPESRSHVDHTLLTLRWRSPDLDSGSDFDPPVPGGTRELCGPTTSRPLLNACWAANHQKHGRYNDMDVALYLRHRSPRCSCLRQAPLRQLDLAHRP